MIKLIDELMAIIMLMVVSVLVFVTCPIWILPYAIYTIWWRE